MIGATAEETADRAKGRQPKEEEVGGSHATQSLPPAVKASTRKEWVVG